MSRLIRFRSRRDRGAIAPIVAILLAGGVLMGIAAVVVDVGQLYGEREELQSGADSAAYRLALDCALKRTKCSPTDNNTVAQADANAKDGVTAVDFVCGTPATLGACAGAGGTGGLTDCIGPRVSPNYKNYVEVHTKTQMSDGSYILPYSFAQTLTGIGNGQTVYACSRVAFGPPSGGLALTFSDCEYEEAISDRVIVADRDPRPSDEVPLYVKGSKGAGTCSSSSGSELPGGFGWTDRDGGSSSGDCLTVVDANGHYGSDTGTGTPTDCKDDLPALVASRKPVAIPIFAKDYSGGSNGYYVLKGFAAFVITGWDLASMKPKSQKSWLTNTNPCTVPGTDCIFGYFTKAVVDWDGSFGPGEVLDAVEVKTVG